MWNSPAAIEKNPHALLFPGEKKKKQLETELCKQLETELCSSAEDARKSNSK